VGEILLLFMRSQGGIKEASQDPYHQGCYEDVEVGTCLILLESIYTLLTASMSSMI